MLSVLLLSACNVKKEEKGELPELDVDISGDAGELPEYDVDWASVDIGTRTKTVKVPKPMIVMEEEEIEVPVIDFNMPGEESESRTLMVEAEIEDKEHSLEIVEIRASQKRLYVISELKESETDLGDNKMRIQDQVELNAPDLDVKHIIIGKKAENLINNQYRYIDALDDLDEKVKSAKVIYSK